jgi:L-2-hydroxyglutarate oxidase
MTSPKCDVIVVGAGIIGLATAMELSGRYPKLHITVLEKEPSVASHQTGHNSGVIHAGLYYRPGSYKANLCVQGARSLRQFCDEHQIKYKLVGKVIVATQDEELPALETLYQRGLANKVDGLTIIGPERLKELEPHASGIRAIHSPQSGLVDYKEVSEAYAKELLDRGGEIITGAKVLQVTQRTGVINVQTSTGDFETKYLINCAGLYADTIARLMGHGSGIRIIPFRGEYFSLHPSKYNLVNGLIYPVPNPRFPFLGGHLSRRINGAVKAGPNAVLAFAREGYRKSDINVHDLAGTMTHIGFWRMAAKYWKTGFWEFRRSMSKRVFTRSLQKLVPDIQEQDLTQPSSGVRAQAIDRQGALLDDFSILVAENAIHVQNAPSPAATSSLAVGQHIVALAADSFGFNR